MSKPNYDAIRIAKQLGYDKKNPEIVQRLQNAISQSEINRILYDARQEG